MKGSCVLAAKKVNCNGFLGLDNCSVALPIDSIKHMLLIPEIGKYLQGRDGIKSKLHSFVLKSIRLGSFLYLQS